MTAHRISFTLHTSDGRSIPPDRLEYWLQRARESAISLHREQRHPGEEGAGEEGWLYISGIDAISITETIEL